MYKIKKDRQPGYPSGIAGVGPVALRPHLTMGLPLSSLKQERTATRLPLRHRRSRARGFASPPYDGFAFFVQQDLDYLFHPKSKISLTSYSPPRILLRQHFHILRSNPSCPCVREISKDKCLPSHFLRTLFRYHLSQSFSRTSFQC